MKHLLLLFLLSCSIHVFAQQIDEELLNKEEVSDYIVFANGDTLRGKIQVSTRIKNQVRVKFKTNKSKRFKIYKAKNKQVIAYGFTTGFIAHSADRRNGWIDFKLRKADQAPTKFGDDMVFMACVVERENDKQLSLFNYYIKSKKEEQFNYLNYYYFLEYKYLNKEYNNVQFEKISRENFESIIERSIEDYPVIRNSIGVQFDYSNFGQIVIEYNKQERKSSKN